MILLCGVPSEPPVELAVEAATEAGIEHLVVNQRRTAEYDVHLDIGSRGVTGEFVIDGRSVDLDDIDGVYLRLMDVRRLPEMRTSADADRRERITAFHDVLESWTEVAACRVANRHSDMTSNGSKPFQAQLIGRSGGLRSPATVVTNSRAVLDDFEHRHGPLIYKSTSSVRSIVRPLDTEARGRLDRLRLLPTQFQERLRGTDVRVHVVGDEHHATEIRSTAVDYRYASRDGEDADLAPTELPVEVAEACHRLSRFLSLPFCGIDLLRTEDDEWYCFEVNPSPGYSYYELTTGQDISGSLVRWLAGGGP